MTKTDIIVAYINQPKSAKGPGSIKDETGAYFKCWPKSKHGGATLADFEVGKTYEVECDEEEYNGKTQYTVRKIVSGGGGNGTNVSHRANVAIPSADRSAFPHENYNVSRWQTCLQVAGRILSASVDCTAASVADFARELFAASPESAHEQAKEIFNANAVEDIEAANRALQAEVSGW